MEVTIEDLRGPRIITPPVFSDERGYFFESYSQATYVGMEFVQDNIALSKRGTVRGLHYQASPGQAKLVSCLKGAIQDVIVDIRKGSSTFGMWASVLLDQENHHQLFVPEGFAHGYSVLSKEALVQYKVSSLYNPSKERSIRYNDPGLKIVWGVESPTLSERDQKSPFFHEIFP